jgi:hypothetical protein
VIEDDKTRKRERERETGQSEDVCECNGACKVRDIGRDNNPIKAVRFDGTSNYECPVCEGSVKKDGREADECRCRSTEFDE